MPLVENPEPKTIGAPVKSVNWVRPHFGLGQQGEPRIYVTMGQQGDNLFLLKIDPATGALEQFTAGGQNANYPTATLMSKSGILYIGGSYAGHLYAFDPAKNALEDLGAINPERAVFPCGIEEDKNGVIWIGSYGTADLTSFDPKTREFTRHGRMDEVDMYNYPLVNAEGMICCRIMQTQPKLVVFDPKTKKKETVGPVAAKNKDTFSTQKDENGRVYIVSSLGNFRIEGFKAVPVKDVPPRPEPKPFHGIKSVKFVGDEIDRYKKMEVSREEGSQVFDLNYEVAGTDIFYIHRGPNDLIYGSSILPLHIFRYTPQTGELVDQGALPGGEAYSMGNLDGLIYILAYTGAEIYSYDPAKPFKLGTDPESNPRDLGRMDNVSYRPRSTLTGPLGRVWVASIPDYGLWGGPLSWYDPNSGEKKAYYDIAGDASCYTLAYLDKAGLIAVGTTIDGGSGTLPKVQQANLFLWDPAAEKKAWEGTLDSFVHAFNALVALPDGRIIGTVTAGEKGKPAMFVFNSGSRRFEKTLDLPEGHPLDLGLQLGLDGYVYGFTRSCFYRVDPKSLQVEEIFKSSDEFDIAGPILGKDVYYAKGWILKSLPLFK
jgi:outer membrane protein assembly factor BamB